MIPKEKLESLHIDLQAIADLAAATGVSYFKGAFRKKAFDGKPWTPAKIDQAGKRRRGSLMVDTAALMNSIRTAEATTTHVVWAAGNDKVPYAQVHNEGGRAGRGAGFDMTQRLLSPTLGREEGTFSPGVPSCFDERAKRVKSEMRF